MKVLALLMMVIPFVRCSQDLSGPSLDASERGTLSQYLAPRMLVKTRYQSIFFSIISLEFINNTSFTFVFLYKRLQKEKRV